MSDLFASAADEVLQRQAPLAARLRPRRLDDLVGHGELIGPEAPLRTLIEADRLTSLILWGPPGCGKTTLARLIANHTEKEFITLSAVSASVKDVRLVIEDARRRLGERSIGTILFLDEVHRYNKSQQDPLLPSVEDGLLIFIGATTENPYFEVNAPLLSRSNLFRLNELTETAINELLNRGVKHEEVSITKEAAAHLTRLADGDARRALTALEVAVVLAGGQGSQVQLFHVEQALDARAHRYGDNDHYDVISAFIKSLRGSDVDAALHWLARMLEAGEDARFIARRMVILASEDIGMADPTALLIAEAAARAVEFVGLPEAQLNLAQAVIHLALAPKSNSALTAISRAREDVRLGRGRGVPIHLRDGHYSGAKDLGHGDGYEYPHRSSEGWVAQQYLPDDLVDARYYEPSKNGRESDIRLRQKDLGASKKNDQESETQR
ncbi:MAG: replication-associated recombination protein A [Actinomycetota bacterium]|nr:replication-associated recombination protein A [Actinomycetota bacterium]